MELRGLTGWLVVEQTGRAGVKRCSSWCRWRGKEVLSVLDKELHRFVECLAIGMVLVLPLMLDLKKLLC